MKLLKNGVWMLKLTCGDCHRLYVGPYAEQDAELALKLYFIFFKEKLLAQDLTHINELEHQVLPVLIDMKWNGVRVDIDQAEQTKNKLYLLQESDSFLKNRLKTKQESL
jgi:DNA polymerase I-like protein with 3'-5' exonuclease and polymerase domains